MLGARLKTARHAAGLSLRDLAPRVGVSAMALSKYEREEMTPSSTVLIRLSNVLERRLDYFMRPARVAVSEPQYRRRASMSKKDEAKVRAQVEEWVDRYIALEHLVGDTPEFSLEGIDRSVASVDESEGIAEKLREAWSLGFDPIENMADVLEFRGIRVGSIEGSPKFDALTFLINDNVPVIAVKQGVTGDRERFSMAHELGHLVLDPGPDVDAEAAATRFAEAFLVPRSMVLLELGPPRHTLSLRELSFLKCKYGLSMRAWIYRASHVGIIDAAAARRLHMQFAHNRWTVKEPGDQVAFDEPRRLRSLAMRALAEGVVSRERAEELYGADLPDLNALPEDAAGVCC